MDGGGTRRSVVTPLRELTRAYVRAEAPAWPPEVPAAAWLDAARRARLTPLLDGLLAPCLGPADDVLAAGLRRDLYRSAARRLELGELAGALLGDLAAAGIPVIALKGAVLGERLYPDPAHRPMDDVDLLVRPADVPEVLARARRLGLARVADRHSLAFDLRFGATVVLARAGHDLSRPSLDVHWRLVEDWRYGGAAQAWLAGAWQRAGPTTFAGQPVLALAPSDLLVHLAVHLGLHHAFDGWLWHCDIALLLARERALDWDLAVAIAELTGFKGALALALAASQALFGSEVPPAVQARLQPRSLRWRLARRLCLPRVMELTSLEHLEHGLPLLLLDSGSRCARVLARWALPPRPWIALRYEPSAWPVGYLRHGGDTLRVVARTLTRR
jgi:hypothetical protein